MSKEARIKNGKRRNSKMKIIKLMLLSAPVLLSAENFSQIQKNITDSLKYKMQQEKVKIYEQKLKAAQGKDYGSLDAEYNAVHFFTRPVMKLTTVQPVAVAPDGVHLIYQTFNSELPMADKNHFSGVIKYSYPLFTGFALSSMINKAKLEVIKQKLNLQNVKRELILNTAKLYSDIYAVKAKIYALNKAKEALLSAKEKAQGFYKEGLVNKSSVDEINAKYYEIIADIRQSEAVKNSLLQTLSYILNKRIASIDGISVSKVNFKPDFQNRPDVKAIKETLKISDQNIKLAKSKYYPQVGFEAGIKREADDIGLTSNDYQNIDKSYVGVGVTYNIFDGGAKKADLQMAKIAKNTEIIFYTDYLNNIKTEYKNDLDTLKALFSRLQAAKEEIKARMSYYEYIKAKFDEGLADSSDLNDAVAKLAEARAKKEAIKANIFFLDIKLKLNGGYDE